MSTKTQTVSTHAIADVPATKLAARVTEVTKHLQAIEKLMADAVVLTDAERKVSLRLQDAEAPALDGVLQFAAARPELFTDLADEDEGVDPNVFETKLLRERLANAQTLSTLASRVQQTLSLFTDSALYVTGLAKKPALAAYEIAKPYQTRDRKNGSLLNAAVNLYRAHSLAASRSRKANKAKSATGTGSSNS